MKPVCSKIKRCIHRKERGVNYCKKLPQRFSKFSRTRFFVGIWSLHCLKNLSQKPALQHTTCAQYTCLQIRSLIDLHLCNITPKGRQTNTDKFMKYRLQDLPRSALTKLKLNTWNTNHRPRKQISRFHKCNFQFQRFGRMNMTKSEKYIYICFHWMINTSRIRQNFSWLTCRHASTQDTCYSLFEPCIDPIKVNSQVIPQNVEHQDAEIFLKITSL